MRSNIESIAIKNLRRILSERGISAESLFEKFDMDGNGTLSKSEFDSALRSVTGQVAPNAVVNAIFGALDADSSSSLELAELLTIIETGQTQNLPDGGSINVSGHPSMKFNGNYEPQPGQINGKTWYKNPEGSMLYHFSGGSGANSWNLDDRIQEGGNDWYRGGWTRSPSGGGPPMGIRRWVGIGKITLSPAGSVGPAENKESNDENEDSRGIIEAEIMESQDPILENLLSEIEAASKYFEEQVTTGKMTPEEAIDVADSAFDKKTQDIPAFLRSPARREWNKKMDQLRARLGLTISEPSTIAAGTAAIGVAGSVASGRRPPMPSSPPNPANLEPPAEREPEPLGGQITEDYGEGDIIVKSGLNLGFAISEFQGARTLGEREAVKQSLSTSSGSVGIRVKSVERTFGIGITDEYRGGNTVIAEIADLGDVEIRIPASVESIPFKPGFEGELQVSIADWNAVRRRLVLESQ